MAEYVGLDVSKEETRFCESDPISLDTELA